MAQIFYTPVNVHITYATDTHFMCGLSALPPDISIYADLYEFMLLPTTANSHKCHVRQFVICVKEVLFGSASYCSPQNPRCNLTDCTRELGIRKKSTGC